MELSHYIGWAMAMRMSLSVPVFDGLAQVGGHPALDFLNTVKYRGAAEPGERLRSFADCLRWARVAGLVSEAEVAAMPDVDGAEAEHCLRQIITLREAARRLFDGADPQAAALVARRIEALRPVVHIDPASGALSRSIPLHRPRDLAARITAVLAGLLEQRPALRIKTCEGHDCDWLFIDRSKAGRRRWCDSRICGNAARVRRYRAAHGGKDGSL